MLVTDFDGTLAEIVSDPVEALIMPGSLHGLERLVNRLRRVAILSSRPTSDLESLVPLAGADLIGDSGVGHLPLEARQRLDSFNAHAARNAPAFEPDDPGCPSRLAVWQYSITPSKPDVDVDLASSDFPFWWP